MGKPNAPRAALARAIATAMTVAPFALLSASVAAQDVDLGNLGDRGFRIDGSDAGDFSGRSVSGAGDVNGDGLADLLVGASSADPGGDNYAGESYVVFGKPSNTVVDLANLGSGGFRIDGIDSGDSSGSSVSGAGDVNGDGLDDLLVGAYLADSGDVADVGEAYVIFGKADSAPIDLSNPLLAGLRLEGIAAGDQAGVSVSGAGDVNGDGLADLIVGAWRARMNDLAYVGQAYVVFGRANTASIDLSNLGSGGFRIDGADEGDSAGTSVSGAGDVNGDGLSDVIIGASAADPRAGVQTGAAYVVFGRAASTPVSLSDLGEGGFRIDGIDAFDNLGRSVSGAGDVNGDGLADLIIGAPQADPGGESYGGESYVVFGKAGNATVDLGALGNGGFRIDGADFGDASGSSVSGAGDVNGDGFADLLVGAYGADGGGRFAAGQSYVIFGSASSANVELATLGARGVRIDGASIFDFSGRGVSGAGDVNGDGLADILIGAPRASPGERIYAGEVYLVFSTSAASETVTRTVRSANGNPPPTAVGISGDGSNDGTPDSRVWIDFADGGDPVESASTELVTLTRAGGLFPSASASVSWRVRTTRQDWTSAEVRVRYLDSELQIGNENLLQLVYSPNGSAPFMPLTSVVNPLDNTISANISGAGFLYIGQRTLPPEIFADGFEPAPP